MLGQFPQFSEFPIPEALSRVRVEAHGGAHLGMFLGQSYRTLACDQVNPWNQDTLYPSLPRPLNHRLAVGVEVLEVEVAMGVYKIQDSNFKLQGPLESWALKLESF